MGPRDLGAGRRVEPEQLGDSLLGAEKGLRRLGVTLRHLRGHRAKHEAATLELLIEDGRREASRLVRNGLELAFDEFNEFAVVDSPGCRND